MPFSGHAPMEAAPLPLRTRADGTYDGVATRIVCWPGRPVASTARTVSVTNGSAGMGRQALQAR